MAACAAAISLAGCNELIEGFDTENPRQSVAQDFEYVDIESAAFRAYQTYNQEAPFAFGPMSIVSAEHGEMHTYQLFPCGDAVCGGSVHGPRGHVGATPNYVVVTGLYGRTFWLSPGGDGAVVRSDGTTNPLAWDSLTGPH